MVNKQLWMLCILVGCLGLLSCTHSDPYFFLNPKMPVTVPFAMDKAGASVRIDFSVSSTQVESGHRLMVALDFPQTEHGTLEDVIQQGDILVEVEVFRVDRDEEVSVPTQDDQAILHRSVKDKAHDKVARLHLYGTDGYTSNVLIAGFYPRQPGHYFAKVKTIRDLPMFSGVKSILKIAPFYNTGE